MIGSTISHYQIVEKLGAGGMGVVFKARDLKLDRFVALKFLPPHLHSDEEQKQRFIHEAKAASAIDHPNIGAVHEIDETSDGQMYIVMAYYDGESLKGKMKAGQLSIDECLQFGIQMAEGLSEAHKHGIIHRDLKPQNVIITENHFAKIIDFGLAKLSQVSTQLTRVGTTVGTVSYMSPEQARGDEITPQTDIWSLGVILYEMVAGRLPFRGDYEPAVIYSILNEAPALLSSLRPDVPSDLEQIILGALEKDPELRYQTIEEMLGDLRLLMPAATSSASAARPSRILSRAISSQPEAGQKSFSKTITIALPSGKNRIALFVALPIVVAIAFMVVQTYVINPSIPDAEKTIVVIPIHLDWDPESEYIAEGITGDLIAAFSKIPRLTVISRTTSDLFKKTDLNEQGITDALGVRFLLKGKIQLKGMKALFAYELYDAKKEKSIVAASLDLPRSDIYTSRERIMRDVLSALHVDQPAGEVMPLGTNLEAYTSYLRGLYHLRKGRQSDNAVAIEFFHESLRHDSLYVPSIISLARAQTSQFENGWDQNENLLLDAEANCLKTRRLDSTSAEPFIIMGSIHVLRGEKQQGIELYKRALEIEKDNATALTRLAILYLVDLNKPVTGIVYLKRLQESDPTDWFIASNVGAAYGQLKNYPEAIQALRRSIRYNPEYENSWTNLGYVLERIANYDSATQCYQTALRINPMEPQTYENLVSVLLALGKYAMAESVASHGMNYLQGNYDLFYQLGVTYALSGKQAQARQKFEEGLGLVEERIQKNPKVPMAHAAAALFHARLRNTVKAVDEIRQAVMLDSTDNEILMRVSRAYAVLGKKTDMLDLFGRAKALNPEYDAAYLTTAIDFERYRNDSDLLTIARRQ